MKSYLLLLSFLLLLSSFVKGQITITGNLIDSQTEDPVEFATIYCDGTTRGCRSNSTGFFCLENIEFPCTLVISHVSYTTKIISLNNNKRTSFNFSLEPKKILVEEVGIHDKNQRKENLQLFKELFLGNDVWGKYATIENEDALVFNSVYGTIDYETINNREDTLQDLNEENNWHKGDSDLNSPASKVFMVYSNEPIIIDLPLLGYKLNVNLINFISGIDPEINYNRCSILGFYYFMPVIQPSKRDSIRILKNRQKAYYNSPMHFFRSLFEDSLSRNGYAVYSISIDSTKESINYKRFSFKNNLQKVNDELYITGLKNKEFLVDYYTNINGKPMDITKKIGFKPSESKLILFSDTVIIRKDGTVPDNSTGFSSVMGDKKIGAYLPSDYMSGH